MSANDNGSDGGIDYDNLYVYAGREIPDRDNFTVYADDLQYLFKKPVSLNIIGSSHLIHADAFGYNELTVCVDPEMKGTEHYSISDGIEDIITRKRAGEEISLLLKTFPLDTFHIEDWDLVYTFEGEGPSAPTAIDFNPLSGWRTVHRYPEFKVDLYTETRFEGFR